MKYFVFLIIGFSLISCQSEIENPSVRTQEFLNNTLEFDEITHYQFSDLNVIEHSISDSYKEQTATYEERLIDKIGYERALEWKDTTHIKDLERIGYKKKVLSGKQYNIVSKILLKKNYCNKFKIEQQGFNISSGLNSTFIMLNSQSKDDKILCTKEFRDVLVFKKNNKIVGFAKVCFYCTEVHFVRYRNRILHIEGCIDVLKDVLNG